MSENPWNTFEPFEVMFCDTVTVTGRRPNSQSISAVCAACVYPPCTEEQFTDNAESQKVIKQKILLAKTGELSCSIVPKIGDCVRVEQDMYVAEVKEIHTHFDLTVRSKK